MIPRSDVGREILNLKIELLEIKYILKDLISPVRAGGERRREAGISDGSDASILRSDGLLAKTSTN